MRISSSMQCAISGPSFGGINLEDIKAPECFIIEQRLKELMDIPVFHVMTSMAPRSLPAAGLLNALELTGRDVQSTRLVVQRRGRCGHCLRGTPESDGVPAAITCMLCDTKGVIYQGRSEGMNQWKSGHAVVTDRPELWPRPWRARIVSSASARKARSRARWSPRWRRTRSSSPWPIRTRRSRPKRSRPCARMRSWRRAGRIIPNQVNNVLGFPYLFRGALDVQATTINMEMKIAAAKALAELAARGCADEVAAAYSWRAAAFRAANTSSRARSTPA